MFHFIGAPNAATQAPPAQAAIAARTAYVSSVRRLSRRSKSPSCTAVRQTTSGGPEATKIPEIIYK